MEKKRFMENSSGLLIQGECVSVMSELQESFAGQIKCALLDPPYSSGFVNEQYSDAMDTDLYLEMMENVFLQVRKLLRRDGFIFVQIGGSRTYDIKKLLDSTFGEKNFRSEIVVSRKRDTRKYRKGNGGLYCGYDSIFMYSADPCTAVPGEMEFTDNWTDLDVRGNETGFDHEQNAEIPARIINGMTSEGDIVLDPFLGSGTTAAAAIRSRRRWIGIEQQSYCGGSTRERLEKETALAGAAEFEFEEYSRKDLKRDD